MTSPSVLAVVVSYNGREGPVRVAATLRDQVRQVVIVDNGSGRQSRDILAASLDQGNVEVVWLGDNAGVGAALNVGLARCLSKDIDWLLTMDQDSVPAPDMVAEMLAAAAKHHECKAFSPSIDCLGRASGPTDPHAVDYAITSGNLVAAVAAEEVGGFDEDLFIDGVDFDFSLKLRKAGHLILSVPSAKMGHHLGEEAVSGSGLSRFHTYHSPLRRYYMYRNVLLLFQRYSMTFPRFAFKLFFLQILQLLTIMIYGRSRLESYRMICLGIWDFFRGRKGKWSGDTK